MENKTLRVLKSGAGYYIGTLCEEGMPFRRVSCYFRTEAEAAKYLPAFIEAGIELP